MVEVLADSFLDVIRVAPVLFIVILLMDWIDAQVKKGMFAVKKLAALEVPSGALLGIIPQCGVAVAMARLYGKGYITLGMLVAVFLASSDEALVIISADPARLPLMFKIIMIKVLVGIGAGMLINLVVKDRKTRQLGRGQDSDYPLCCSRPRMVVNSLAHTLKITLFLFVTVLIINLGVERFGEARFFAMLGRNTLLQPVLAAFIGMVPSCFSSVLIAEGFIKGALGWGSMLAGLMANTGYGILVLFRELPLKQTLMIILYLQVISILVGEFVYLVIGN